VTFSESCTPNVIPLTTSKTSYLEEFKVHTYRDGHRQL